MSIRDLSPRYRSWSTDSRSSKVTPRPGRHHAQISDGATQDSCPPTSDSHEAVTVARPHWTVKHVCWHLRTEHLLVERPREVGSKMVVVKHRLWCRPRSRTSARKKSINDHASPHSPANERDW